jgi:hypothetical protein
MVFFISARVLTYINHRYIRSNIPLDDLERRSRYPLVDPLGKPLLVVPNKLAIRELRPNGQENILI